MKSILILTVTIAILGAYEMVRRAVDAKQEASKSRLAKRKDEFEARMMLKKQRFNDYKAHIESLELNHGWTRDGEHVVGTHEYVMNYPNIEYGTVDVYDEIDVRELEDDVDIKELKPVTLSYESGVNNLILSTHHTYRPYETNTLDIHDTLREFTVGDVLGMFY